MRWYRTIMVCCYLELARRIVITRNTERYIIVSDLNKLKTTK
jgi:hypothetical protein